MLRKIFSTKHFWSWTCPLVILLNILSPRELSNTEVSTLYFLALCWWGIYGKYGLDYIQENHTEGHPWITFTYCLVMVNLAFHFISTL